MTRQRNRIADKRKSPDWIARFMAAFSLLVALAGLWLNYAASLPALSAKIALVEPIAAGQLIKIKADLQNMGSTTARAMRPHTAYKIVKRDVQFQATYKNPSPQLSEYDLAPGGRAELSISEGAIKSPEHQHDADALISGDLRLYFYGKISYRDVLGLGHEFHFCGYHNPAGLDPLAFAACDSYNETN